MPIEPEALEKLILSAFPGAGVEIRDLAGDMDHYEVKIVSAAFRGKSRLDQHRMVQEAVKGKGIHALAIKTSIPE